MITETLDQNLYLFCSVNIGIYAVGRPLQSIAMRCMSPPNYSNMNKQVKMLKSQNLSSPNCPNYKIAVLIAILNVLFEKIKSQVCVKCSNNVIIIVYCYSLCYFIQLEQWGLL